jgi:hypothetical protein
MWIPLLINSYVRFTFLCRVAGTGTVPTLRAERLGFLLRQGQKEVCLSATALRTGLETTAS